MLKKIFITVGLIMVGILSIANLTQARPVMPISQSASSSDYAGATTSVIIPSSYSRCTLNGKEVPCEQAWGAIKGVLGWVVGVGIFAFILCVAATVFWIVMLIHVATKPVPNKEMWIILMIFTGVIGSLVYYFVVKRPYDKTTLSVPPAAPPTTTS